MKNLVESKLQKEHILTIILQESLFKNTSRVSNREFWNMIKAMNRNVPEFIWDESVQPGSVWGFLKGTRQSLFRYDLEDELLFSQFTFQELLNFNAKSLRKFLVSP